MKSSASRITWVLALLTVVLLIAVAVVVTLIFNDRRSFNDESAEPTTSLLTATATETSSPTQSTATVDPPAPEVTTDDVVPEPIGSTPTEGGSCLETEARSFATSAGGQSLVCTYMGAGGGYMWVGHAENNGAVHNIGDPCDSSVDRVSQDPSGKAIMCGGDTWVGGP
ncbi:hypothetical protein [Gordonia sp. (in: high G+C Gram-positive bacteria)]|uniref:hypothetical protein n=1 Tax=Gordonia sp. (in: high G+C Gram-positive bacteria) TaxID=84139 RepID=UPI003F974C4F